MWKIDTHLKHNHWHFVFQGCIIPQKKKIMILTMEYILVQKYFKFLHSSFFHSEHFPENFGGAYCKHITFSFPSFASVFFFPPLWNPKNKTVSQFIAEISDFFLLTIGLISWYFIVSIFLGLQLYCSSICECQICCYILSVNSHH